jgi:tetratricopeptide (TPR) repeat protein
MPFEKAKTLSAAEKFLEMGKIPDAIREYSAIVEHERDDFTTLNMLGDLYVRVNNRAAAISCFRTIAEHYREQDFVLKAIAMFKKIDRLQPSDPEIALNLADLYAQQKLVVDARSHYLIVAESYKNSGATEQALEILRKIADLDPHNTDLRVRLAEDYAKQDMNPEAVTAFNEAGHNLVARGSFDRALEVFSRALEINPSDYAALKGFLAAHVAHGTAAKAADALELASADNPDDVPLLSLLATAYIAAEDDTQADRVVNALVAKQSSEYLLYVDVLRIYLKHLRLDEAVRILDAICDRMLADREDSLLLALADEVLNVDAANLKALTVLTRAYWWQRDVEKLKAGLERLAETARAAESIEDERYALTRLTRVEPDCAKYAERLEEIGGALDEIAEESFPQAEAEPTETIEADQFTFEQVDSTPAGEAEFEWNSVVEPELSADVTENWSEPAFTFEAVVAEELRISPEAESADQTAGADEERKAAFRRQELESVDFYIAQGYVDIANDTLNLLEQQFGPSPEIEARRQELNGAAIVSIPDVEAVAVDREQTLSQQQVPDPPVRESAVINQPNSAVTQLHPELAEIFEEYRVSAEAEVASPANGDYETHYNLGLAYKEMDLFEEALEEFQIAVKMITPGDRTGRYLQCCNLLGHCFLQKGVPQAGIAWFDKGLNSPDASEEERQALRYELAAAYEQSGDLKRALELFTEVYGYSVTYRGVKDRMRTLQARIAAENGDAVPQLPSIHASEQLLN